MTRSEMNARYDAAMAELETQKKLQAGQSYAAGASILLFHDSATFHRAAFFAKCFLALFAFFAAFYLGRLV